MKEPLEVLNRTSQTCPLSFFPSNLPAPLSLFLSLPPLPGPVPVFWRCYETGQLLSRHSRVTQSDHGSTWSLREFNQKLGSWKVWRKAANENINTERKGVRPWGSISASRLPLKCGTNSQALPCSLPSQNTPAFHYVSAFWIRLSCSS